LNAGSWLAWRLRAELALWRYGWGAGVAVLVTAAAGVFWVVLPSVPADSVRINGFAKDPAEPGESVNNTGATGPAPAGDSLQQELTTLLPLQDAPRTVDALVVHSQRQGVLLDRVDIQYQADPQAGWIQAGYTVPLRGSYVAVRKSLEAFMREQPHVAIDRLSLRRDGPGGPLVVQVQLSGWYRPDGDTHVRSVTSAQPGESR
jgi:hypothetical protein